MLLQYLKVKSYNKSSGNSRLAWMCFFAITIPLFGVLLFFRCKGLDWKSEELTLLLPLVLPVVFLPTIIESFGNYIKIYYLQKKDFVLHISQRSKLFFKLLGYLLVIYGIIYLIICVVCMIDFFVADYFFYQFRNVFDFMIYICIVYLPIYTLQDNIVLFGNKSYYSGVFEITYAEIKKVKKVLTKKKGRVLFHVLYSGNKQGFDRFTSEDYIQLEKIVSTDIMGQY